MTIRIDTVRPDQLSEARVAPAPAPERQGVAAHVREIAEPEIADPWTTWLLRTEAAVSPYSRWIVLAAIVAALGLTLVLLQGAAQTPLGLGETTPPTSFEDSTSALAGAGWGDDTSAADLAPRWDAPTTHVAREEVFASDFASPPDTATPPPLPPLVAAGPRSAAPQPARATLTGEVVPYEQAPIAVASAPTPSYPRTAAVAPDTPPATVSR